MNVADDLIQKGEETMLKSLIKTTLSAAALGGVLVTSVSHASDKIVIAEFKWPSAQAYIEVMKQILEQRFGLEVEKLPGNNAIFYPGMSKGEIDFHIESWLPNQIALHKKYVAEEGGDGTVVRSKGFYKGEAGVCVPRYFSEAYNVTKLTDLARPEIAKLLDTDGDGRGEIWAGNPAWIVSKEYTISYRDHGLNAFNDTYSADAAVWFGNLKKAISKKAGIAGYCWTPDGQFDIYDLVQLEQDPHNDNCHKFVNPQTDEKWMELSKITCAGRSKHIHIVWSKKLEEKNPLVVSLLQGVSLETETLSGWAYEIQANKRKPEEVAAEWIAANKGTVDSWLGM